MEFLCGNKYADDIFIQERVGFYNKSVFLFGLKQFFFMNAQECADLNLFPYLCYSLNCLICSLNLSSPRDQIRAVVIVLCLTPDDFTPQWRAPGWERVQGWIYSRNYLMLVKTFVMTHF